MKRADVLAREHTEKAIATLAEAMDNPMNETRERISAAKELLDRGHGKAAQAIIALPPTRQQAAMLAGMSDEDLMAIVHQPLPRLAQMRHRESSVIDAEFSAVPSVAADPLLS